MIVTTIYDLVKKKKKKTTIYDIIIVKETKNQIKEENQKVHQHTWVAAASVLVNDRKYNVKKRAPSLQKL